MAMRPTFSRYGTREGGMRFFVSSKPDLKTKQCERQLHLPLQLQQQVHVNAVVREGAQIEQDTYSSALRPRARR